MMVSNFGAPLLGGTDLDDSVFVAVSFLWPVFVIGRKRNMGK